MHRNLTLKTNRVAVLALAPAYEAGWTDCLPIVPPTVGVSAPETGATLEQQHGIAE